MMVAQVIFFVALTLFLILLVRRVRTSSALMEKTGATLAGLGRGIGQASTKVGGRMIEQAKRARKGIPLLTDRAHPVETDSGGHAFWQEQAIEEKPELAGFFDEGDQYFKKGEYDKAEEFFLKAATRNPGDARVYARLGVIYLNAKNYNDAIEALKVAVKYDKYNPSRHYNLALAYHGNNDRQKAIASVREAIVLDPVTKKYRLLLEQLLDRK